jgi:hypothetical protein
MQRGMTRQQQWRTTNTVNIVAIVGSNNSSNTVMAFIE